MAKKKDANKYWINGEDAELIARFTGCLNTFLRTRRSEYIRNLRQKKVRELPYEENTDYIDRIYSNLTEPFEDTIESKLMWEAIRKYLYTLTPKECEVMISIYIDHLSESETAKKLNVERNTVSTHKRNAVAKIRKAMEI